jgi:lambda family phage portal protein
MRILDSIANRFGYQRRTKPHWKRNLAFKAAENSRLTEDWPTRILSADAALGTYLRTIRSRSRDLERNDSHARGYGKALTRNVLGAEGIQLQSKVTEANGTVDRLANLRIEDAWYKWGIEKWCDSTRQLTWRELQRMALLRSSFDGEVLLLLESSGDNPFGFSLRMLEGDYLDESHNENLQDGSTVRMGVETDKTGRVTAYHVFTSHPGDNFPAVPKDGKRRVRLLADRVIHLYMPERSQQTRGFPWLTAALRDLGMLAGYKEAELVAARVAASKAGFITKSFPDGMPYSEDDTTGRTMEVEPGIIEELPMGAEFTPWDPTHPNTAFGDFIKSGLRGVATGLGMSYNTLSSDLEGVNFSSIRAGLLDEREEWLQIQSWLIDHLCRPVFRAWLQAALLTGAVKLPPEKIEKFTADTWRGRRWQWVDPERDVRAGLLAVEGGLKSRRQLVAEAGADFAETLDEIAEDNKLAKEAGVQLAGPNGNQPVAKPGTPPEKDGA